MGREYADDHERLCRIVEIIDTYEPLLERMLGNPAARFALGVRGGKRGREAQGRADDRGTGEGRPA
ncbi:MAG: hypothetical protein ACYCV4_18080 [Dermatophilaceae bacterium]